ncbi:MAG TPA: S41 family peptidase [Allosphingosinicella sp.]|jgi:hypothetical protein
MRARPVRAVAACLAALLCPAVPSSAEPPSWSPRPWLEDLDQVGEALRSKYANLEWLEGEREVKLDALLSRARSRLAAAGSDAEAIAVFNRLIDRIADGHVTLDWPAAARPAAAAPAAAPASPASFCSRLGYDAGKSAPGAAKALPGYAPAGPQEVLPSGTVRIGGETVGVVRIGVFDPHGSPSLCTEAVAALSIPVGAPCDDVCEDKVLTFAYRRLTAALDDRLVRLRALGAASVLVDLTGNGGGSEWAEAAARMFSRRPLASERTGFIRGEHWTRQWATLGERLRDFAAGSPTEDRAKLLGWAAQADAARAEAARTCTAAAPCPRIVPAGFTAGLVGRAPAGAFAGKAWAPYVFSPAQYPYRDGGWDGPVMVLVDQETWSAAEEFAAILQDNRAAIVVGARSGGAGCGHTNGGTPTRLRNSGAILEVPDCVRFRADGSNEVRGIVPDVLVGWRHSDGIAYRASLLAPVLPGAIAEARRLYAARRSGA